MLQVQELFMHIAGK